MKTLMLLTGFVMALLMVSCQGAEIPTTTPSGTPAPSRQTTPTPIPSSPNASGAPTEMATPTVVGVATSTVGIPAEARLKSQCLEVVPRLPSEVAPSGVVILDSRVVVNGRYKPEAYLLDMATGKTITIEHGGSFIISPDRTLMAYDSVILDKQDRIIKNDLVIADASGQQLKVIPWEKEWSAMLGWSDNQHLILSQPDEVAVWKPNTLLVLNPFSGERQLLHPDFPRFLDVRGTVLPYWDGWYGVIYDPTLTRAIYPRFVGDGEERFTYAIWDRAKRQLVISLENIFVAYSGENDMFPRPRWSPDGTQFVFRGLVHKSEQLAEFELYRLSRDGQAEQLTHLTSIALVQDSNLSWSPDGRHIAMFLDDWGTYGQQAHVAVLDTTTLDITDYCVPVMYTGGAEPPIPIWSLDGKQFLVMGWDKENHTHVILVDIAQGFAAQIAEDMEPVGWMKAP